MTDLVERLYNCQVCSVQQNSCLNSSLIEEAAARIEELEGQLEAAGDLLKMLSEPQGLSIREGGWDRDIAVTGASGDT